MQQQQQEQSLQFLNQHNVFIHVRTLQIAIETSKRVQVKRFFLHK